MGIFTRKDKSEQARRAPEGATADVRPSAEADEHQFTEQDPSSGFAYEHATVDEATQPDVIGPDETQEALVPAGHDFDVSAPVGADPEVVADDVTATASPAQADADAAVEPDAVEHATAPTDEPKASVFEPRPAFHHEVAEHPFRPVLEGIGTCYSCGRTAFACQHCGDCSRCCAPALSATLESQAEVGTEAQVEVGTETGAAVEPAGDASDEVPGANTETGTENGTETSAEAVSDEADVPVDAEPVDVGPVDAQPTKKAPARKSPAKKAAAETSPAQTPVDEAPVEPSNVVELTPAVEAEQAIPEEADSEEQASDAAQSEQTASA